MLLLMVLESQNPVMLTAWTGRDVRLEIFTSADSINSIDHFRLAYLKYLPPAQTMGVENRI